MSSSDEEWMKPPTLRRRASGKDDDPMLAARRQALQSQRDAAQSRIDSSSTNKTHDSKGNPPLQKPLQTQENPKHTIDEREEELESLSVQLEAKKKELLSLREKETALRDRWRAQKAERIAENAQLDGKLRQQKGVIEDAKAEAERELRELEDEQQRQLHEERRQIDREIAEEYEPQLEAQRVLLEELQKEELKLRGELNTEGAANDVVSKCISSAVSTILQEVQSMFDENASNSEEWICEVEKLVRSEVQSSFSVTCNSEAQREIQEQESFFNELLDFWRKVEEEERDYTLKIDENLLQDFTTMVNEDLDRMQEEELAMEGIYIQAQEAWSSHYQEMLNKEIQGSVARQTAELEEQQALRHQLHIERMKVLEEQHQDMMEKQQWLHEKEVKLIREQYAKEEELEEERDRVNAEAQLNAARATEESKRLLTALEELFDELKNYKANVDEGRVALENDRQRDLDAHVETLTVIKDMVGKQNVSMTEEQNSISAAQSKLEILGKTVDQHLEDERIWLEKQETKFLQAKAEWDRECHRWQRMVDDQKCEVEGRFNHVLNELNEAASLIMEEGREAVAERDSVTSAFRIVSEQAAAEVEQLRQREEELNERHEEITRLLSEFDAKDTHADHQWQQLQQEREELEADSVALREDEVKLRELNQYAAVKTQCHEINTELAGTQDNARATQIHIRKLKHRARNYEKEACQRATPEKVPSSKHPQAGQRVPTASNKPTRLPLRILGELREMLGEKVISNSRFVPILHPVSDSLAEVNAVLPHLHEHPLRHDYLDQAHKRRREHKPRQQMEFLHSSSCDPTGGASTTDQDASSNKFTHLFTITDTESFNQSL